MRVLTKIMKIKSLLLVCILILTSDVMAGTWNGWIYQNPFPTSVNLFDVKFVTPKKGWITGKYGYILYTDDGGLSWDRQNSGTEEDIMRVAFVNEKSGWAVGKQGSIIHTEDGGKTWVKQYNANTRLTKVFFINEKEGWVTGVSHGAFYVTKNGGKTWEKQETGIKRAISSVYFINSNTGWILAGEDVYRTINGGKNWDKAKLPVSLPAAAHPMMVNPDGTRSEALGTLNNDQGFGPEWWFGGIAFVNEKQGWVVTSRWIFYTNDGGRTWTIQFDTGNLDRGLRHISFNDVSNGCASGWSVYCTDDGGKIWTERLGITSGQDKELGGIDLSNLVNGWVVGNNGVIMKSTGNSRMWEKANNENQCGSAVYFHNKNVGIIYDPQKFDVFCRTANGGQSAEKTEIGMKVTNVFFIDEMTGWAVGVLEEWKEGDRKKRRHRRINVWGVIKKTIDGGISWSTQYKEPIGKGYDPDLSKIFFISDKDGWAAGANSLLLHTEDGGAHWERNKSILPDFNINNIFFVNAKQGWLTGLQIEHAWIGVILFTEDGGRTWKVQAKQRETNYNDIQFVNHLGWVNGETEHSGDAILFQSENVGKAWTEMKKFESLGATRMIFFDKDRGVMYSPENGSLVITFDGGKTWTKKLIPLKKNPWNVSEIFN